MSDTIEQEYAYLWNEPELGWCLVATPRRLGGYTVYNPINNVLLSILSEETNAAVCARMKEAGCKVVPAAASTGPIPVEPYSPDKVITKSQLKHWPPEFGGNE